MLDKNLVGQTTKRAYCIFWGVRSVVAAQIVLIVEVVLSLQYGVFDIQFFWLFTKQRLNWILCL